MSSLLIGEQTQRIAVIHSNQYTPEENETRLKRLASLFDKIDLADLDVNFSGFGSWALTEWLLEQGVCIASSGDDPLATDASWKEFGEFFKLVEIQNSYKRAWVTARSEVEENRYQQLYNGMEIAIWDALSRIRAINLSLQSGTHAIPVLDTKDRLSLVLPVDRTRIIEVVINKMPAISEGTPWEAIIEFRSDEKSREKLLALRAWMSRVVDDKVSVETLLDELNWAITDYEKHLKLHKIESRLSRMRSVVLVLPQFLEDLLHLRPAKAIANFFDMSEKEIAILKAERELPHQEAEFLFHTDEFFKARSVQ